MTTTASRVDTTRELDAYGDTQPLAYRDWPVQPVPFRLSSALRDQLGWNMRGTLSMAVATGIYIGARRVPQHAYVDLAFPDAQSGGMARCTALIAEVLCVTRDARRDALLRLRLLAPTARRNVLVDAQREMFLSFTADSTHRYEVSRCARYVDVIRCQLRSCCIGSQSCKRHT